MSLQKYTRLKYLVSINTEHAESNEGYVGLENVESWSGRKIETNTPEAEGVALSYQKGDVLFGKLRPYLAKCYVAEEDACCSMEFLVMRPKKVVSKYLQYRILSAEFIDKVNMSTYGAKMPRANWSFIGNLKLDVPSMEEQQLIANYLDDRCSKIDAIIAEAKASIEEYKELKQAVIYEAVTIGTEKDVPLKDSGIYGWGNVPQHWQKGKMKAFIESVESGLSAITGDDSAVESGNYVLRTSAVSSGEFKADEKKAVLNNALDRLVCPVEKDTLVMSRMNTAKMVGYCAYIAEEQPNTYLPDKLWKIKTKKTLMPKYAWYLINSNGPHEHFASIATGTSASMINITKTDLYAVDVVVPSVEEQLKITKHIDKVISKIDELCSEKQSLIEDLEAYKKSLIYEVVTGKRKVVA